MWLYALPALLFLIMVAGLVRAYRKDKKRLEFEKMDRALTFEKDHEEALAEFDRKLFGAPEKLEGSMISIDALPSHEIAMKEEAL